MAENPLLPDAELRSLHALLQAVHKLVRAAGRAPASKQVRGRSRAPAGREALLAATILQLRPGDLLIAPPEDAFSKAVLKAAGAHHPTGQQPETPVKAAVAPIAVAMASALKTAGNGALILLHLSAAADDTGLYEALRWAQTAELPLVLAIADPSGDGAFSAPGKSRNGSLRWESFGKTAQKIKLPILHVDGQDAVAVYRVMQESALRARSGGGPAVLWAVLPTAGGTVAPPSGQPLARLKRYLRVRGMDP